AHIQSGLTAIIGALIGAGLIYWIAVLGEIVFRKPAMGEGDVKFVAFIGAFCGWQGAVFAMFGGAVIGSLILLPILLLGRIFGWTSKAQPEQVATASQDDDTLDGEDEDSEDAGEPVQFGAQVPFGPMLAVAGLIYFLGFGQYVDAYFAHFAE